ncbi:MAG: hypothetical protein E7530_03900 [Ruminococcaceae bacterium]|nr:hypothetical protein [Oscillospiraceae bacterium]
MKERKSFLFYYDWANIYEPLDDIRKAKLITATIRYAKDNTDTKFDDLTLKVIFNVIKDTIDRDSARYNERCLKNAENIKKRWNKNTNEYDRIQTNTNYTDIDIVKEIDKDIDIEKDTDRDIEKDSISSSFSSKTVCEYSDDFLDFWKEYPKKVGKGDAFKKWKKAKLTNTDKTDIMNALNWQKKSDRWRNDYGRFIPNPSTYISQRRWEDEPDMNFNSDITDPSRYTDGDTLPDFILRGDY